MSGRGDLLFVTPRIDDNSIGRTLSLWLLAQADGWRTTVVSPVAAHGPIWAPLRGSQFAQQCRQLPTEQPGNRAALRQLIRGADRVVVVKAVPESLGRVADLIDRPELVLVDVDDPDIEARTRWLSPRARAGALRQKWYWELRRCRRLVRQYRVTVSNPVLQRMYGGRLLPHARTDPGAGRVSEATGPKVAFVGTAKAHKGIDVLRAAVDRLTDQGFRLSVTAPPPPDAKPHETWVGQTSFEQGLSLVADADVIAVPSLDAGYARAQFPVKIVDAQLAARAVVATDVGPIAWALNGTGALARPGDVASLTEQLLRLRDPEVRAGLGQLGRAHALRSFTVEAVLPAFHQALNIDGERRGA